MVEELAKGLGLNVALVRVVRLATMAYAGIENVSVDLGEIEEEMAGEAQEYLAAVVDRLEAQGIPATGPFSKVCRRAKSSATPRRPAVPCWLSQLTGVPGFSAWFWEVSLIR